MRIAVLLLYYRQPQYINACVQSLLDQSYHDMDIVCIDNASNDGAVATLAQRFPTVKVHASEVNAGYSKTYNIWMKHYFESGYDACIVMNTDTVANSDMVHELVASYTNARDKVKIGLLQPSILLMSDPNQINTIGNSILFTGIGYCPDYKKPISIIPHADTSIISVSGCCMFVPRAYFLEMGGFDERYFMYMEDQEYSVRGLMKGYTHLVSVRALLRHDYSLKFSVKKILLLVGGLMRFTLSYPFVYLKLARITKIHI
ncbi:MAG: glycosyltransferase family 2 protein [Candidatus Roizmanbacteria bacterium]